MVWLLFLSLPLLLLPPCTSPSPFSPLPSARPLPLRPPPLLQRPRPEVRCRHVSCVPQSFLLKWGRGRASCLGQSVPRRCRASVVKPPTVLVGSHTRLSADCASREVGPRRLEADSYIGKAKAQELLVAHVQRAEVGSLTKSDGVRCQRKQLGDQTIRSGAVMCVARRCFIDQGVAEVGEAGLDPGPAGLWHICGTSTAASGFLYALSVLR